jgi:hypothetical protein
VGGGVTIGVAAWGPGAGRAALTGLRAVERIGRGAVGGYVSFVALTAAGDVLRAQIQRGGAAALFGPNLEDLPATMAAAPVAGLMSSGPDRPEPLSRFTPAAAGVGLVTGHRMPNVPGADGAAPNEAVLALMAAGLGPRAAVTRTLAANPDADAGLIALTADGRLHVADSALVRRRGGSRRAMFGSRAGGARAAALCNAIHPGPAVAATAAAAALDAMQPPDAARRAITIAAGAPLRLAAREAIAVGADGRAVAIHVCDPRLLSGEWSFGLGPFAPVVGAFDAVAVYEPFMTARDGALSSVDGRDSLKVGVR